MEEVQVAFKDDKPRLVVLFPARRIHEKSKELWSKVASLGSSKYVFRLVLIDKTSGQEASEFFLRLVPREKLTIYVCDPMESIFASQGRVTVPTNTWIAQIHDDDDISGELTLPPFASKSDVLRPSILLTANKFRSVASSAEKLQMPAFSLFSFIPSEMWNLFTHYIRAQGKECSPSLDVALNYACSKAFRKIDLQSFHYYYHFERWRTKKKSKIAISKYMRLDGWHVHSNYIIAEFASQIDKLLFSVWCDRYQITSPSIGISQSAFKSIFPTKRHVVNIRFQVMLLHCSSIILRKFGKIEASKAKAEGAKLDSLVLKAYSSSTSHVFASILIEIAKIPSLFGMQKRFEFWSTELLASTELFK